MRIVRFSEGDQKPRIGILAGDKVVALSTLVPDAPLDMRALIPVWDAVAAKIEGIDKASSVPLASVKLHAPVDAPEKVLAIGLNYADHILEARELKAGRGIDTMITPDQVWFCKQPNTIAAPFADIELPRVSEQLDYEIELVVVIGKGGRHISAAAAPDHVFGYMVGNDVSVRDWQIRTQQWMLGKSFDGHGPIGPAIVTADELGDPHRLNIKCSVNGELRQNANTRNLVFNVWQQIEELSKAMTLRPGDLLFTGTPGGVGIASNPPQWLKVGDVVRCEIEDLGAIENRVVAEAG